MLKKLVKIKVLIAAHVDIVLDIDLVIPWIFCTSNRTVSSVTNDKFDEC